MFDLKLDSIVQMLVDHELDRQTPTKILNDENYQRPGVYLPIILKASENYHQYKSEYIQIFMLFTGDTSVFYATDFDSIEDVPNDAWINTSNHNSCWRSDGFQFLHDIQMKLCENVNPNIAPIKLHTEATFSIIGNYPIKHCIVTYKNNTEDNYGYKIVNIEPIR